MSETVTIRTELPQVMTSLPYHRLNLVWASAHRLRPLWGVLLAGAIYLAAVMSAVIAVVVLGNTGVLPPQALKAFDLENLHDPWAYLVGFASVALMLPAIVAAFAVVGHRPGLMSSIIGRLRRGWLLRMVLGATAIWVVFFAVTTVWDLSTGSFEWSGMRPQGLMLILVALLITPLQAAAEEYVFRGALAQMVGTWLRHPAWAIVLPLPLFVAGHGYQWAGLIDVAIFGLAAGWLAWRTGGLESAIAMHVVNNTLLGVAGACGLADLNSDGSSIQGLALSLAPVAVFVAWVEWRVRREHLVSTRLVPVEPTN